MASRNSQIKVVVDGKYSSVPIMSIQIVERPTHGEEDSKLFYNPRSLGSFDFDTMLELKHSIQIDGLQQPPLVRAYSDDGKISSIELIAGERRFRSCLAIYGQNLPCFDEDSKSIKLFKENQVVVYRGRFGLIVKQNQSKVSVKFSKDHLGEEETKECDASDVFPTKPGKEVYANIPCKIIHNCSDQRALRLAFAENDQSEPLTTAEEIALVERLERMGKKQNEIAEILGSNVTWVSQTGNFKSQKLL